MPARVDTHELAMSPDYDDKLKAARLRSTSPADLIYLTRQSSYVALTAWRNPNLPRERVLEGIRTAHEPYSHYARVGLSRNPAMSGADLLALDAPEAAANPNYPQENMMEIALYGTKTQQLFLAQNKKLYQDVQDAFCYHPSAAVRKRFAKNRYISVDSVGILAEDSSPPVLRAVINHPLAGPYRPRIIEWLKNHAETTTKGNTHSLSCIAKYTEDSSFLQEAALHSSRIVYEEALANTAVPVEALRDACYSSDERKRTLASENTACPEEYQVVVALLR